VVRDHVMTGCGRAVAEQDKVILPPTFITDISGGATVNFGIPVVKEFSNKLCNKLHNIMYYTIYFSPAVQLQLPGGEGNPNALSLVGPSALQTG